jgi:hypothetical protein
MGASFFKRGLKERKKIEVDVIEMISPSGNVH